jgi:hypothetical protein
MGIFEVLHPKYKLNYFEKEEWPMEWKEAAKTVLWTHWEEYYKPLIETDQQANNNVSGFHQFLFSPH